MSFDPISAAFDIGKSAIERIWPDPIKQAQEINKLQALRTQGNLAELNAHVQLMMGQISINLVEAKSDSLFKSGWRPSIGWIGSISMGYQFVLYPIFIWIWSILQLKGVIPLEIAPPPILDTSALFVIITGMLGIGVMRSVDKRIK